MTKLSSMFQNKECEKDLEFADCRSFHKYIPKVSLNQSLLTANRKRSEDTPE